MRGNSWNLLPFLVALMATEVALQHGTCDNEKRWQNQVMCLDQPFGALVPYPDNCNLFLVCNCEYPTVKECPPNLWWDNEISTCNYPHATKCVYYDVSTPSTGTPQTSTTPSSDTNTTVPITTTTEKYVPTTWSTTEDWSTTSENPPKPPPGVEETFCEGLPGDSMHKYKYDCNAYINCTSGWPVLNYCKPDKVFNDKLKICDTPEAAECEPLPLPPSTVKPTTTEFSTTTKEPTTTTEEPTTTTEESTTTTEEPTTTTEEPTTTTEELITITEELITTTEELITTTEEPTTTTEVATTTTDDGQCTSVPPLGINEHYCERKGNGFYEYPYDCSAYISCKQGCTYYGYCITDKLFNPVIHICDTPHSVNCNPKPYPTTTEASITSESGWSSSDSDTSTIEAITTTAGLPEGVDPNMCKNKPNNIRYPSADNCAEYFQCRNNQVIVAECPRPMLFNADMGICDNEESVSCYGDRTSTSTTRTTSVPTTTLTTLPSTTMGPAEFCDDKDFGDTYRYVQDCAMYVICLGNGNFYIARCIMGTYYNPQSGQCDGTPTACQEQSTTTLATTTENIISTTTTSVASTTSATPVPPGGICAGKYEGEMIAYPKVCSKYIVCVSPIPVAFFCMENFYFSVKQQQCVHWTDSDCDLETNSTPVAPQPPLEPNMCTNSNRDTLPYPENCQWFIRCVDDNIYMMDVCKCNEYYDPIRGECGTDVPLNACRWDYTSTTSEPTPTPTPLPVTRPPPQKGPCDDAADGELVQYPNDCSKYIKCNRPIPDAFDCDVGFEFNPESRKCVEASLANCSRGPSPGGSTTNGPDSTTNSYATSPEQNSPTEYSSTQEASNPTAELSTTVESSTTDQNNSTESSKTEEISTTESNPETEWNSTQEPTTVPYSTTAEATTEQATTRKPSGGICVDKKNGTKIPYPDNCEKYIICQEPIPIGYDCPNGLEFSPTELECMEPDSAKCIPKPTTPSDQTTEDSTTQTPVTIHPNTPNICCGYPLGTYLAYPNDCNRYVICDYPVPQVIVCEEGTAFDEKYLQCTVWAQENVCN